MSAEGTVHVLSPDECERFLASAKIGRVILSDAALPTALPVRYAMVGKDIVFRSGPGLKLSAASAGTVVAFEVDDFNEDLHVGWSVVVTALAAVVTDPDEVAALDRADIPSWVRSPESHYVRLTLAGRMSGRRLLPMHEIAVTREARVECLPDRCPCDDQSCTLSRYVRATRPPADEAVAHRLVGMDIDVDAMAAVQNLNRAANAVRKRCERNVLADHGLTWTAWEVLWAGWIWGDVETRHLAYEAGISKPTLTGVLGALETRGLLQRRTHPEDARRVLVALTDQGKALMSVLLPEINGEERTITGSLTHAQTSTLARQLRTMVVQIEDERGATAP